jgi:cyanophycinase
MMALRATPARFTPTGLLSAVPPCLLAVVAACAPAQNPPRAADDTVPGPLVVIGGGLSPENAPVFREMLARKLDRGPICVLPTASAEPDQSAQSYVRDFERYGGQGAAVALELTTDSAQKARDPGFAERLARCGGFFFTGGDQSRIVDVLRPGGSDTPAARALRRAHRGGAMIAGSSAGAAMMSDPMIGAGSSRDALRHGVSSKEAGPGVWVRTGMGFFDRGLTGQHFLARGRLGRHLVALAAHPGEGVGIGVDEDTAAILDGDRLTVAGRSQVVVTRVDPGSGGAELSGRLWLLGDGDAFDLGEDRAFPGESKRALEPAGESPAPPVEPFEDDRLHRFLAAFAQSRGAQAAVTSGEAALSLRKPEDFRVWAAAEAGEAELPGGFGSGPFAFTLTLPEVAP